MRKDKGEYEHEVSVQNSVAKSGYAVEIIDYEFNNYPRQVIGNEPEEIQCFFIMVMPKLSYSLHDKMNEYPFFGMEAA